MRTPLPSSEGYRQAVEFLAERGLPVPQLSDEHAASLEALTQVGCFGTRDPDQSLYDLDDFVQELLSSPVEPYLCFGVAGHGVTSQALHYYYVDDKLAVFIQLRVPGPGDPAQVLIDRIDSSLAYAKLLHDAMGAREVEPGTRLVIVESDFLLGGYGWIEGTPGEIDESTWTSDATGPLGAAFISLQDAEF